ncbi:MAG: cytochrome c biogenesis CcdA family protein, partial [Actinomycetota bacterium]
MLVLALVAAVGGAASVLTPCVLPVLPALLTLSGGSGRKRLLGLVLGIELSFFVLAITLAAILGRLGLPLNLLQWLAAGMLLVFGLVLVVPRLESAFSGKVSRLVGVVPEISSKGDGMLAGLATGLPLGIVWTPCAGPILAGITLAATARGFSGQTLITLGAYAAGMFGPLLAVTLAGRKASGWLRRVTGGGRRTLQV